jgi:alpha-tubulin suppressor-like RCC1 family protein
VGALRKGRSWRITLLAALLLSLLAAVPSARAAPTGSLYAFGLNQFGQLGNTTGNGPYGNLHPNPTPTLVSLPGAMGQISQIAVGGNHTLALTSSGQLYAFGVNRQGQLGNTTNNGNDNANPTPSLVTLPGASGPITQIAAGFAHSLAVTSTGQLYSFGSNDKGQLGKATNSGNGTPNPTPTQVTIPGLPTEFGPVVRVAAGAYSSFALTSNGQVYSFGWNNEGQLGREQDSRPGPSPRLVIFRDATGPVKQIAGGGEHTLALTSTGQFYSFGWNNEGQLGNPTNNGTNNANPTPTQVTLPGASGQITQIAGGFDHSLAVTATGQLYAFGANYFGELGKATNIGTGNPNPTPTLVALPDRRLAVQIGTGDAHTVVLTVPPQPLAHPAPDSVRAGAFPTAQLYAFGWNDEGQLGNITNNGTNYANPTPLPVAITVPFGSFISALSRGSDALHTLVALARFTGSPVVSGLRLLKRTVSSAGRRVHGRCVKPTRKNRTHKHCIRKVKLKVTYTLNVPARITFKIQRQISGRKVKGRCVKQTHTNRKHKHCKRLRTVGTLSHTSTVATDTFTFKHKLAPGTYYLVVTASANGHTTSPQTISFKVTG